MCKIVALLVLCASATLAAAQRSFTFGYALTMKDVPAGAHMVDVWLRVPHDDPCQSIINLRVDAVRGVIHNHVAATVKYDKSGKGWGNGDIYSACDARRGNCTDFHAIFIGYARAVGIPARFAPARREYFFGAHDEDRVEFSKGSDVQLVPRQQGAALNYFVYPYVEVDGGKYTAVETTYSYTDMPI